MHFSHSLLKENTGPHTQDHCASTVQIFIHYIQPIYWYRIIITHNYLLVLVSGNQSARASAPILRATPIAADPQWYLLQDCGPTGGWAHVSFAGCVWHTMCRGVQWPYDFTISWLTVDFMRTMKPPQHKYLRENTDNKVEWVKNTTALYRKGQSFLYFLRQMRSFNICWIILYESVVGSAFLCDVACCTHFRWCWGVGCYLR